MNIIEKNIKDIKPYENNPRNNEGAVEKVAESIKEFGFQQPIVVDKDNVVIVGHTRLKAAERIGLDKVPVVVADELTEEQAKAYRLADNKTNEIATWKFDVLNEELLDIGQIDMSKFGFDMSALADDLVAEEDDYVPDEKIEPKVKQGDIWQLGEHRLMCGDSTSVNDVETLMGGVQADMVFTDPPYGYNYQSNMRTKSEKFDVLDNDDKILDFFPNLLGRVKGFVMICTTWKVLDKWLPLFKQYFDLSNMIIWDKGGGYIGDLKHTFGTDYEIIMCSNNNAEIKGKRIGSVWSIGKDTESDYEHPTQKPVELSATAILSTTEHGDIVLDCFGGSGSTLIACEQLNRKCYVMELDPHYCSVIIDRWESFTGQKAIKING